MTAIFAVSFFMPLGNERFMTALDATLDLAQWYAQEHVVLCLLPAFFIAGVIAVFVSQGAVLKYFGANAKKWLSYTIAAISGGILAGCSCTILPLFTSIYKRGAGLGPAIAFLYSGPAISILSIIFHIFHFTITAIDTLLNQYSISFAFLNMYSNSLLL